MKSGKYSGKFVLRTDPKLHALLISLSQRAGVSLNQLCNQRLVHFPGSDAVLHQILSYAEFAEKTFGQDLLGIVLFDSYARGENTPSSDLDLLVILREGTKINRELYRPWEEIEEAGDAIRVEPSLVALPDQNAPVSGLWAEVAIDGIILFEAGLEIHQYLSFVRKSIADGKLKRQRSHGQNYYIKRCGARLLALKTLDDQKSWPDVVRESQEVVELALKALLRKQGIEFPRIHDVSAILKAHKNLLPKNVQKHVDRFCRISKSARRDREIAFYGTEDLSPLEFYSSEDAKKAMEDAKFVVNTVKSCF